MAHGAFSCRPGRMQLPVMQAGVCGRHGFARKRPVHTTLARFTHTGMLLAYSTSALSTQPCADRGSASPAGCFQQVLGLVWHGDGMEVHNAVVGICSMIGKSTRSPVLAAAQLAQALTIEFLELDPIAYCSQVVAQM